MTMRSFLGRMVHASLATSGMDVATVAAALKVVPEAVAQEIVDDCEDDSDDHHRAADRVSVLQAAAADRRPTVRRRAAAGGGEIAFGSSEALIPVLHALAGDPDPGVRQAVVASLAALLGRSEPLFQ